MICPYKFPSSIIFDTAVQSYLNELLFARIKICSSFEFGVCQEIFRHRGSYVQYSVLQSFDFPDLCQILFQFTQNTGNLVTDQIWKLRAGPLRVSGLIAFNSSRQSLTWMFLYIMALRLCPPPLDCTGWNSFPSSPL